MELLVCVVNDPNKIDEILEAFLEIGITGATIIDSAGMGGTLVKDVPVFADFKQVLPGQTTNNKTIFSVIADKEKLQQAITAIEQIVGNLQSPATGIIFTVPVNFVKGLKPEL